MVSLHWIANPANEHLVLFFFSRFPWLFSCNVATGCASNSLMTINLWCSLFLYTKHLQTALGWNVHDKNSLRCHQVLVPLWIKLSSRTPTPMRRSCRDRVTTSCSSVRLRLATDTFSTWRPVRESLKGRWLSSSYLGTWTLQREASTPWCRPPSAR